MGTALSNWLNSNSVDEWAEACNYLNVDQIEPAATTPESDGQQPLRKGMERAMQAKSVSAIQINKTTKRDRVVLEHLPLVKAIAVRVYENLPVHVDLDDLVHAGILGLFDAALKYDDNKQVTFQSYAKHRIKGSILDSLRDLDWASRDLRKRHKRLEEVTRELTSALDRTPNEVEIAEKMGMDLERWRQVAVELRMVGLLSASSRALES